MTAQPGVEPARPTRPDIPYDPEQPARWFRTLARTYGEDAALFRRMPPREHIAGRSAGDWADVYSEIRRELLHVAHLIDGGDR